MTLALLTGALALAYYSVSAAHRTLLSSRQSRITVYSILLTGTAQAAVIAIFNQPFVSQAPTIALVSALGAAIGAAASDPRAAIYAVFWMSLIPAMRMFPEFGLWFVVLGDAVTIATAWRVNVLNRRQLRKREREAPQAQSTSAWGVPRANSASSPIHRS